MPIVLDVGGVCRHRRLYIVFLHAVLNDATHMPVGAQKNDCALAGLRVRSHRAESAQSQARECAVVNQLYALLHIPHKCSESQHL